MLAMLLEHSRFDTIMETATTMANSCRLPNDLLRLLLTLRRGMSSVTTSNGKEEDEMNSRYVVSRVLLHYGATLSSTDRKLRVVLEEERDRVRSSTLSNSSSMFEVETSLWGESARIRGRNKLMSKDISLALHERWDEWFFWKAGQ